MTLIFHKILLALLLANPVQRGLEIAHVRSGHAVLRQQGRLTVLEITSPHHGLQRIALTHPSDYRQTDEAPFETRRIAESSGHFLIFTDSFVSNPGNVQGMCGASETGERFVHVVALGPLPHETLSVLVESCLSVIIPAPPSPEWQAVHDSVGSVGKLTLHFDSEGEPMVWYYVSTDGEVGRPQVKSDP